MKIKVTTLDDMSNMVNVMEEVKAEIKAKTGNELEYSVSFDGPMTVIDIPKVAFIAKKGIGRGFAFKLKKKMLQKGIEAACLKHGFKADVVIE